MVVRIWHGWTTPENADAYEQLLRKEIFVGITERNIAGFRSIQLLQRDVRGEVEFTTIMWFDNLAAVKEFAGQDFEQAVIPASARALLARYNAQSTHYNLLDEVKA